MESLFGCKMDASANKEPATKGVVPPAEKQHKGVLDPKKSQNIAILLRALNVTKDEVVEALFDGMNYLFASIIRTHVVVGGG